MIETYLKHGKFHQLHEYEIGNYFLGPALREPLSLVQLCHEFQEKLTPA